MNKSLYMTALIIRKKCMGRNMSASTQYNLWGTIFQSDGGEQSWAFNSQNEDVLFIYHFLLPQNVLAQWIRHP